MMPGLAGFAEEQLATFLQNLASNPLGWQAAHVHFSRLNAQHRRPNTIRIAISSLQDLARRFRGKLFLLYNFDVVVLLKGAPVGDVGAAVAAARNLFLDDPVAADRHTFSTWYDLSVGLEGLGQTVRELIAEKVRIRDEAEAANGEPVHVEPLDPGRLDQAEQAISSIDISAYLRRQPVCAVTGDAAPRPVFEELYVRIADLQRPLMPNVNLAGNRWLFQHLTQALDLRVLATLTHHPGSYLKGPVSLNMNIDTVLSESFAEFDASLKEGGQRHIVIEIQPIDLFADYKAFQVGREYLRAKGYRLCIDGLTPETMVLCDRRRIGVDLVKVHWSDDLAGPGGEAIRRDLAEAVTAADPQRVILSRCDDEAAVTTGNALGIGLFQGRHIDELLKPGTLSRN